MEEKLDYPYVETVLGPITMPTLGTTLTHEHLLGDSIKLHQNCSISQIPTYTFEFSSLKNFGYLRQYPYNHLNNLVLTDEKGVAATYHDIALFKESNGGTIVDKNSHLNRTIGLLKTLSNTTKVNIIVGAGYHITDSNNISTCRTTTEEMYNQIHFEFENGCKDYPKVKPAFVADGGNIHYDFEKRTLRAIGELQGLYGYPVSFHPGKDVRCSLLIEIMRIYQEAGGQARKFVMSHIDRTLTNIDDFLNFVDQTECYLQFDQFGVESSFYQLNVFTDILSDAQSIKCIAYLKQDKKLHRVLMSNDIHTKHRLTAFGGLGYVHITKNIVPFMIPRGFNLDDIHTIRVENPSRWLNRLNL